MTSRGRRYKAWELAYYRANRERLIAYQRAYYEAHRERLMAYQRAYDKANRSNIVHVAGMRLNRRTDPPELIAIAERIKETKALLKEKGTN